MMWRHRCKQHVVSVGNTIMANTELPQPELPGVMRVTPAGVTLVVVGEPTLESQFASPTQLLGVTLVVLPGVDI